MKILINLLFIIIKVNQSLIYVYLKWYCRFNELVFYILIVSKKIFQLKSYAKMHLNKRENSQSSLRVCTDSFKSSTD